MPCNLTHLLELAEINQFLVNCGQTTLRTVGTHRLTYGDSWLYGPIQLEG
jgi:hypothetical protein